MCVRKKVKGTDRVDPIIINRKKQDVFPKTGLMWGYIGDRVPLCADFLEKMHLHKVNRILYHLLNCFSVSVFVFLTTSLLNEQGNLQRSTWMVSCL